MSLDATGLTILTAAEIEAAIITAIKDPSVLGPQAQLGSESPLRQVLSVFAVQLAACYELLQQIYEAQTPDDAAGDQLDRVCAQSTITREGAARSTTTVRFIGTASTFVDVGTIVRIPDGAQFVTIESGTISATKIDLDCEAVEYGPVEAASGTITELVTSIAGISSVTNLADAELGRLEETDEELRQRREASLAVTGSGTDAAIAAHLRALDSVDQALVISNRTPYTDSYGISPHGIRPIVWPAAQTAAQKALIYATLWAKTPSGIPIDGTVTGTVTDSQGTSQPVAYSPATEVAVHVEIVVTTDPTTYGGDTAVSTAVEAATADPTIGADLLLWRLENRVTDDVTGILTIEARAKIGATPTSADTANITAGMDEIITVDSGDITVTSS